MTRAPSRLWIFSDLHQDCPENGWDPAAHASAGGFDVAVVAGDVHMSLLRALDWLGEQLPPSRSSTCQTTMISGGTMGYAIATLIQGGLEEAACLTRSCPPSLRRDVRDPTDPPTFMERRRMPPETSPTDGEIRNRAFHLWERRDRPRGHADEFRLQAERELHGEMTGRPFFPDGYFAKSRSGSNYCC